MYNTYFTILNTRIKSVKDILHIRFEAEPTMH